MARPSTRMLVVVLVAVAALFIDSARTRADAVLVDFNNLDEPPDATTFGEIKTITGVPIPNHPRIASLNLTIMARDASGGVARLARVGVDGGLAIEGDNDQQFDRGQELLILVTPQNSAGGDGPDPPPVILYGMPFPPGTAEGIEINFTNGINTSATLRSPPTSEMIQFVELSRPFRFDPRNQLTVRRTGTTGFFRFLGLQMTVVPEPATAGLLACAMAVMGLSRLWRRRTEQRS